MEIETQQRAWEGGRLVQSASESSRKLDYEAEARLVAEARAAWERRAKGEVEDDDEDDPEMLLDWTQLPSSRHRVPCGPISSVETPSNVCQFSPTRHFSFPP
jgi:hypothetical protein